MTTVDDFLGNPKHFLHRINVLAGQFEFVDIDRDLISSSTFLDDQTLSSHLRQPGISLADVLAQVNNAKDKPQPASKFIFHIGFCCSTLISRALDAPGTALGLREPNVFHNLADFKRQPKTQPASKIEYETALDLGLRLLNRPFEKTESVIIKPANINNNLIADIIGRDPAARAVFLYVPLKSFLVSILKKGEPGRAFCRKLFMKFGQDAVFRNSEYFKTPFLLTDLQVVVFLWLMQMQLFQHCLGTTPGGNIHILNGEHFLDSPAAHLTKLAAFFDLPLDKKHFDQVVAGPVFGTDSKRAGRAYSSAERAQENREVYKTHARAFDEIMTWSKPFLQSAGLSPAFSSDT